MLSGFRNLAGRTVQQGRRHISDVAQAVTISPKGLEQMKEAFTRPSSTKHVTAVTVIVGGAVIAMTQFSNSLYYKHSDEDLKTMKNAQAEHFKDIKTTLDAHQAQMQVMQSALQLVQQSVGDLTSEVRKRR